MSKFHEKLDALYLEGKALRKWSAIHSVYVVYDGPYWGIWTYFKHNKAMHWKPFEWLDINGECVSYRSSKNGRIKIKEPVVPCLQALGLVTFHALSRSTEFHKLKKLNVWYIQRHREYTQKYMGDIIEWMRDLLKDNKHFNYLDDMVTFLYYTQEAGYKWLKENPARIMSLSIINDYGRGYKGRKVLSNYLLKFNSAKKALKKHYPRVPAVIINTIVNMKSHLPKCVFNARHEMSEEALRLYSEMIYVVGQDGSIKNTVDPKKASYFSHFGHKHGQKGLQFWRDTDNIIRTANYYRERSEIAWPEILNRWEELKHTLPMAEIRHYHDTASEYNRLALREAQIRRAASQEKENKKAIEMYHEYTEKLIIPEGMYLLTKASEFLDEGEQMHHCIGGYFGTMQLFFKIHVGNDRASMQMTKDGEIIQLYAAWNKPVTNNIREIVKKFLESNGYRADQIWVQPLVEKKITTADAVNDEGINTRDLNPFVQIQNVVAVDW